VGNYNDRYGGERSPGPGHFGEEAGEASRRQEDYQVVFSGRVHRIMPFFNSR